jgi:hypothetical protein
METRYTALIHDDLSLGSLSLSAFTASLFRLAVRRSAVLLAVLAIFVILAGALAGIVSGPATAAGEDAAPSTASSLQELAFVLGTFFPQIDGVVTAVREGGVEIDRGSNQGVRPGLVLSVSRMSAPFRHPLTGVILGSSETALGVLVIESAADDHAVGRFIAVPGSPAEGAPASPAPTEAPSGLSSDKSSESTTGQASKPASESSSNQTSVQASDPVRAGDRVRIGEERLPVVLVSAAVSQVVTDRFRTALEETGRFHLLSFTPSAPVPTLIADSFLSSADIERKAAPLAAAAREQGADYLMVFDARLRPMGAMGAVLIMETREGRTVDTVQVPLQLSPDESPVGPSAALSDHSPGEPIDPLVQVMTTLKGQAFHVVDFPYRAEHFVLGDLDGDGAPEMVVSDGSRLRIYRLNALTPELLIEEPLDRAGRRQLAIDLADINGTGHVQLFVTAMVGDQLDSYVLQWQHGALTRVAEHQPYYFRVLTPPGRPAVLVGQKRSITTPFYEHVMTLEWTGRDYREGETVTLPKGVTIYDFAVTDFAHDGRGQLLYLDRNDRLVLVDLTGRVLGRSRDSYGGVESYIEYRPMTVNQSQDQPPARARIPARLTVADLNGDGATEITVPQNVPWTTLFERLKIYRYGQIHALRWDGRQFTEQWSIPRVDGVITDIAVARLLGAAGGAQVMVLITPTAADKVTELKELFSSQSQLLFYAVPHASG